jgi:saccharopine dehydrogenase-like NADP-dependent oxidoreductase
MEAFYAGGLDSLAEALAGRLDRLDAKTLRYPGHASQMRFLLDLGFADRTTLDVRTHLTYRDVLLRRLRQRLGGAYEDAVVVRVEADGTAGDAEGTLAYGFVDHYDAASGLSAMQRCTGFPAAAAALLLAERAVPGGGAGPAEAVLPVEPMLALLAERGLVVGETWTPAGDDASADAPGGDGDARARTA